MEPLTLLQCAKCLAAAIAIGLGVIGPAFGMGLVTKTYIESIARQPEVEKQARTYFYIGIGLIEACAIYAVFVVLLIVFVIK